MDTETKKRYGAYDSLRHNNRLNALASFGIAPEKLEKVDQEMKTTCGLAGKRWSINCFDESISETPENEKKPS